LQGQESHGGQNSYDSLPPGENTGGGESNKPKGGRRKKYHTEQEKRAAKAASAKKYNNNNKESIAEKKKIYNDANKEKKAEYDQNYIINNKEKRSENDKNRKEKRKTLAGGPNIKNIPLTEYNTSPQEWEKILKKRETEKNRYNNIKNDPVKYDKRRELDNANYKIRTEKQNKAISKNSKSNNT